MAERGFTLTAGRGGASLTAMRKFLLLAVLLGGCGDVTEATMMDSGPVQPACVAPEMATGTGKLVSAAADESNPSPCYMDQWNTPVGNLPFPIRDAGGYRFTDIKIAFTQTATSCIYNATMLVTETILAQQYVCKWTTMATLTIAPQ